MPVEFALRPRIRLREDPAPARRVRARLPKFALPALAYWLVIGGLVYQFVRHHEPAPTPEASAALAPLTPAAPPVVREWWRPLPAKERPPPSLPSLPLTEPAPVAPPPPLEAPEAALAPPAATLPEPAETEVPVLALAPRPLPKPRLRSGPARALPDEPATATATADATAHAAQSTNTNAIADSDESPLVLPRAPAPAPARDSAPPRDSAHAAPASALPSCEAALASASQDVDFSGGNRAADLPTQAIAAVLENGAWLSSCDVPEHTALDVCVAIKGGRVVGASVSSRPADAALNNCVKRRASTLQFPYSPHVDLARTRF